MAGSDLLYWRIVDGKFLEVIVKMVSRTWVAFGWRPACKIFFLFCFFKVEATVFKMGGAPGGRGSIHRKIFIFFLAFCLIRVRYPSWVYHTHRGSIRCTNAHQGCTYAHHGLPLPTVGIPFSPTVTRGRRGCTYAQQGYTPTHHSYAPGPWWVRPYLWG